MLDELLASVTCKVSCGSTLGTGFLASDKMVLTARHCIADAITGNLGITVTFEALTSKKSAKTISLDASILAEDEKYDVCILSLRRKVARNSIPITASPPRKGTRWTLFGYPNGKAIGHFLNGNIANVLRKPKGKIDVDLSIDPKFQLDRYEGMSGSAIACNGEIVGMLLERANGTIAAISTRSLLPFLKHCDVAITPESINSAESLELASRADFQLEFETALFNDKGMYHFLEGAHGIGKTTFCETFRPKNSKLACLGAYCVLGSGHGSNVAIRARPETLYDWFVVTISQYILGAPSAFGRRSYTEMADDIAQLLDQLEAHCKKRKLQAVLFIDGLNEIAAIGEGRLAEFIGLLPATLPNRTAICLSSPNHSAIAKSLLGRVPPRNIRSIPALSVEACREYCGRALAPALAANFDFICDLCERANGHPLYLTYLVRHANDSESIDLNDFPPLGGPIEQYYERVWQGLVYDINAVHLLSLISRLRGDASWSEVVDALTTSEQAALAPTIERIRHLLVDASYTTIYHSSFRDFLIAKTANIDRPVHSRLGEYCLAHPNVSYCIANITFHLARGSSSDRTLAIDACNQSWVDRCVESSSEPDQIIADIEEVLHISSESSTPTDMIRLLLLYYRLSFRYNIVFVRHAELVADAFIALDKPAEALAHIIRHETLIVGDEDALRVAISCIKAGSPAESLRVLAAVERRCIALYGMADMPMQEFLDSLHSHLRAVLFEQLTDGIIRIADVVRVQRYGQRIIKSNCSDERLCNEILNQNTALPGGYCLTFGDMYVNVQKIQAQHSGVSKDFALRMIVETVLAHAELVEAHGLLMRRESIGAISSDLVALLNSGASLPDTQLPYFLDAIIQLGAGSKLVRLIVKKGGRQSPKPIDVRKANGVDIDFKALYRNGSAWRLEGYLSSKFSYPTVSRPGQNNWLATLTSMFSLAHYCHGAALRALADKNDVLQAEVESRLRKCIEDVMSFSLAERVTWNRSYAIPEGLVPAIYESAAEVIAACFPKSVEEFISNLQARSGDQLGVYTEGFRASIRRVASCVVRHDPGEAVKQRLFTLLSSLRQHVVVGVENRHELVPELLCLVRLFADLSSTEEARKTFRKMLSVSMGPSWYKEDQFSLMTAALRRLPPDFDVLRYLPVIAGCLDRADGEMTFQRFVRHEKAAFLGFLASRNLFRAARSYFYAQSCGDVQRLMREWRSGKIDTPSRNCGSRYPGGAVDEQESILSIVENGLRLDWQVKWALLEVFQFGDPRYVELYAAQYARIMNDLQLDDSISSNLSRRIRLLMRAETTKEDAPRFAVALRNALSCPWPSLRSLFAKHCTDNAARSQGHAVGKSAAKRATGSAAKTKPDLVLPGLIGTDESRSHAVAELKKARKQIGLGNKHDGLIRLTEVLRILQAGGWPVWDKPSECSLEAEQLIKDNATDVKSFLSAYAPLIETERHTAMWKVADHIAKRVDHLLSAAEKQQVLDHILEHICIMIGDVSAETAEYALLTHGEPNCDSSLEGFALLVSLVDHPVPMRREKAAEMLLWLIPLKACYFKMAVDIAFGMTPGIAADVLCGVLDIMSERSPAETWTQLEAAIDINAASDEIKHVSRLAVFYRIAGRAKQLGSMSAKCFQKRLASRFPRRTVQNAPASRVIVPEWAECVLECLDRLNLLGLVTQELLSATGDLLSSVCIPFDIDEVYSLEDAVCRSFRTPEQCPLGRWEAKVRFALNCALLPHVSTLTLEDAESALRIYNPSAPCNFSDPDNEPPDLESWLSPASSRDYRELTCSSDRYFLHYYGFLQLDDRQVRQVECIAVTIDASAYSKRHFLPSVMTTFRSNTYPVVTNTPSTDETCCRVTPDAAMFGVFTPAMPLQRFLKATGTDNTDYKRTHWRIGRLSEVDNYSHAVYEGCMLSVKKSAIRFTSSNKLAWIIKIDDAVCAMIDSDNNILF